MKKITLLFTFNILFAFTYANQGGPDAYGYTWKDSNEPNGPTYSWFDISQIGSPVTGLADDNVIGPKPIGFNFQYYWYQVDKVWIGSNGYIAFNNGNIAAPFPMIPSGSGVNDYIAILTADLNFLGNNNPAQCKYYANADTFCVSWLNVPFWHASFPSYQGSCSFQVILNRADSSITFNYQSAQSINGFDDISSGIENINGQIGLQCFTDQLPAANYCIKFFAPQNPSLQVDDGAPMWNTSVGNRGYFLKRNGPPQTIVTNVKNLGNTTLPQFNVNTDVLNLANNVQVANNDVTPTTMPPGTDVTFTYPNTWNTTTAGTYKITTTTSGITGEFNTTNNIKTQEVVVIDTTQVTMTMNYNNNFTNLVSTSVSWNGGQGGVGMYFAPPVYPARITATKFVITANPTSQYSFYAKIYDDNGPGGSPGTLLDSVAVLSSSVILSSVTTIPVSSNVVIGSGGIYVLWDMGGIGASLGEDLTQPISLHTYEVFNNFWSEYRDREIKDFFIGVDFKKAQPEDVGAIHITSPLNNSTISSGVQVKAYIKNFAATPDNSFIVVNYKLGLSGNTVSQNYTGPLINPGDSVLFTFTQLLYPPYSGPDNLCVWTSKSTDIDNTNDSTCINVTLVGINEHNMLQHSVSIFPVPATNNINFKFDETINNNTTIYIMDVLGNIVYSQSMNYINSGETISINTEDIASGIYNFKIVSDKVSSGKIAVLR